MNLNFMFLKQDDDAEEVQPVLAPAPKPAKPAPQIPPPCWDSRPISVDACEAATHAMCG